MKQHIIKIFKSKVLDTNAPKLKRIIGVDQLRYVFAMWVFFTHGGSPPILNSFASSQYYKFATNFYGWCINGQAAVIGFFLISGLCIHYPNVRKKEINWPYFFVARFLRILIPLFACLLIAKLLNYNHKDGFLRAVPVWTLYCEGFYYLSYPIILWFVRKGRLNLLIFLSFLTSITLIYMWTPSMYFHEIEGGGVFYWKAAIIALPCWILGVKLAENICSEVTVANFKSEKILLWRLGAILLSMITFPLYRFGLKLNILDIPIIGIVVTSQFTLLLYGFYCFFWIKQEVISINFGEEKVFKIFEKLGQASFSIYLVHICVVWIYENNFKTYTWSIWPLLVLFLHIIALSFYFIIEKPSHQISKKMASWVK